MSLVYSTDAGRMCPQCQQPHAQCTCKLSGRHRASPSTDGIIRLQRQTQGRGGKAVTIVTGLNYTADDLKLFAKKLKQHCGSGGTIKNGTIEIQGDHRDALKIELERQGFVVKLSGG